MTGNDIQSLLDEYIAWLREKTTSRLVNGWMEITTPYLDRHNDYLQIYAKWENGRILLTDAGYIIEDLLNSGCSLDSKRRQDLLRMILNGFGIKLEDMSLTTYASTENFAVHKHNLIQTMLAINDLFYLASPTVASLFFEDVSEWLELYHVRFIPKIKFTGQSGYDHLFDLVIPKSDVQPERIIQTVSRPNRETAQAVAFAWIDTKEARPVDSRAYAFLNDVDHPVSSAVVEALLNYDVRPVLWSERESLREELSA